MGPPGGVVADKLTSALSQYTSLVATSPLVQHLAPPLQLWSGRSALVSSHHTLNSVLQGYLPFRHMRGLCAIRSTTCSLWFFVVESLGIRSKWHGPATPFSPQSCHLNSPAPNLSPGHIVQHLMTLTWCWDIVLR